MIPFFALVVPNGDDGAVMLLLLLFVPPPPVPPRTLLPQAAVVVVRHKSPAALLAVVSLISLSLSLFTSIRSKKLCLNLKTSTQSLLPLSFKGFKP
jgi:hypothetical protein